MRPPSFHSRLNNEIGNVTSIQRSKYNNQIKIITLLKNYKYNSYPEIKNKIIKNISKYPLSKLIKIKHYLININNHDECETIFYFDSLYNLLNLENPFSKYSIDRY